MITADNRITVFLTVAEEHSFTQAAYKLGISQPAVSQNIADLERAIGRKLFIRTRADISLSRDGEQFAEYARQIEYWYNALNDSFSPAVQRSGKARKKLTIGISNDYDCHFVHPDSEDADICIISHGKGVKVCTYIPENVRQSNEPSTQKEKAEPCNGSADSLF